MSVPRIRLACLEREVSRLGFGCASLGSRVSPAAGLAALARAHDAGVTWFDVAPSYGDGAAEALLGRFLRGRRESVQVLTKVGIAPPVPGAAQRLARPLLRGALAAMPGLRSAIRARRPAAVRGPLDPSAIMPSLEASLRRLGTDRVEVLALHDATPEEASDPAVIAALGGVLASGKAGAIGIAAASAAAQAGLAAWDGYRLVQAAHDPCAAQSGSTDHIVHGVYGLHGIARVTGRLADPAIAAAFARAGYRGAPRATAAAFLLDHALATTERGVVLVSMFRRDHLAMAVQRVRHPPDRAAVLALGRRVAGA